MWKDFPDRLKKAAVIFFWLLVWQLACLKMDNAILLVSPVETLKTFASQLFTLSFWQAVGFSFGRICLGFFLAFFSDLPQERSPAGSVFSGIFSSFPSSS